MKTKTGYKLLVTEYSGAVTGDEVIYTNKAAADYLFSQFKAEASACPRPDEAAQIKMFPVEYLKRSEVEGLVGRVIHELNNSTLQKCLAETARKKLTDEEYRALVEEISQ